MRQWASANSFPLLVFSRPDEVESIVLRGHPCLLFVDGNGAHPDGVELVRRLKSDAFTAIVPVTTLASDHHPEQVQAWFSAGADEVISGLFSPAEQRSRLDAMLVRTERDVSVHPSTRLPGTTEIEREIRRRLDRRRSSRSATPTSITSRSSTTGTATTTVTGSSICSPASFMTS